MSLLQLLIIILSLHISKALENKCPGFLGESCTDCNYCSDGSICPGCRHDIQNEEYPTPQQRSCYCPLFNGKYEKCSPDSTLSQLCPDGTPCPKCNSVESPSSTPTIAASTFPDTKSSMKIIRRPETSKPTLIPTSSPTVISSKPSRKPTRSPTTSGNQIPIAIPTKLPTTIPSLGPTVVPTQVFTPKPVNNSPISSSTHTSIPSYMPSSTTLIINNIDRPSTKLTISPSTSPTLSPSILPTRTPTTTTTISPTISPSNLPTITPTLSPTTIPTSLHSTSLPLPPPPPPPPNTDDAAFYIDDYVPTIYDDPIFYDDFVFIPYIPFI